MKIALQSAPYSFVTENSTECDHQTAFVLTRLNERYLQDAMERGATAVVRPEEIASYFGIDRIRVIGITGTNGKTTTASAVYSILLDLGYKAALQGTRGFFMNDERIEEKSLTTPTLLSTYRHIYQAVASGCDFFVMEVSSHAIVQNRIEAIPFALKVLTNITQDHLDFHKTLEDYIAAKNSFFTDESTKLINRDEPKAQVNPKNAFTYGIEHNATYKIAAYTLKEGLGGVINRMGEMSTFDSPLHGFFNLYNLLAAIAAVHLMTDRDMQEITDAAENFAGVSGRMECVCSDPLVIVDFAHTPDGMMQVLEALKEHELRVVFGAGGDRDRSKRPLMGRVAERFAKKIYLTSDNPRSEDPQAIADEILAGIENRTKVHVELNRKKAIEDALREQEPGEAVVILGKGDEEYQIIYDHHFPFDDRAVVRELLQSQP